MLISRTNSRGQILPPFESSVGWAVPSGRLARPTLAPCSLPSMLTCAQTSPPSLPPFVRGATGGRVASDQPLRHRCSPGPPLVPAKFLEISHRCSSRARIVPPDPPPLRKGGPGGVKPRVTNPCAIDAHPARHPHHSNSPRFSYRCSSRARIVPPDPPPLREGGPRGGQSGGHAAGSAIRAQAIRSDRHLRPQPTIPAPQSPQSISPLPIDFDKCKNRFAFQMLQTGKCPEGWQHESVAECVWPGGSHH